MSKLYKPSELHAYLKEKGLHARKGLSQNFLIDGNIIGKILSTAEIAEGDRVLEIGPGPGALTEAILEKGAHVTAVEMDTGFAKDLERLQTQDRRLEVVCADILEFPIADYLKKKCKIVANLPYHITTPILTLLLPMHEKIESLTIMVQKEFADRMSAETNTSDYSSFTVFLQFYGDLVKRFDVSPNCFYPKPKVVSTVVHCKLHPPLLKANVEKFFQLTRTAFGKRRKMLRASLKELYPVPRIEESLVKLGQPSTARPEELSIHEFISFFGLLNA